MTDADAPVPVDASSKTASPAPPPITSAEIRGTLILAGAFVACMLLAAMMAQPYQAIPEMRAFSDPEAGSNILVYGAMLLGFTFVILYIAKHGKKWLIRTIILTAVGATILYGLYPLLHNLEALPHVGWQGYDAAALWLSLAAAVLCVFGLLKHPEWWVIDIVGLLVAAVSAAIFGISLAVSWVVVLLAALAVYDAIAVYRTKHMLSLADTVIELRLPVLLVIPKHLGYSFMKQAAAMKEAKAETKGEREAMFMGLGDLVMPTILVVAVLMFMPALTTLPLQATAQHEPSTGLPLSLEVTQGTGHPLDVFYRITSTDPASTDWAWSVDLDADGEEDYNGTGLPAVIHNDALENGFDRPMSVPINATVTSATGTGNLVGMITANYVDDDWTLGARSLMANTPALGAALGTLLGYAILMTFVLKGNPQAGLPLLNGGAILGFLAGLYATTGSIQFW